MATQLLWRPQGEEIWHKITGQNLTYTQETVTEPAVMSPGTGVKDYRDVGGLRIRYDANIYDSSPSVVYGPFSGFNVVSSPLPWQPGYLRYYPADCSTNPADRGTGGTFFEVGPSSRIWIESYGGCLGENNPPGTTQCETKFFDDGVLLFSRKDNECVEVKESNECECCSQMLSTASRILGKLS